MKPRRRNKTYGELEQEWSLKLKTSGFVDIEDTSKTDRPLKEWHSMKFLSERVRARMAAREIYNRRIEEFLNSKELNEICSLIVKHGNSSIGPVKVKRILEFHCDGYTERAIAKKLRCGKKCVHITLKKVKEWMKVA